MCTRFKVPLDTFTYLKTLLGVPSDAPVVTYYAQIASARLHQKPRRTRRQRKVTHVVVAVPPYYPQFEHDAIADAIEITGLRTLAIINDGTAVAVNYAMTRTFPTPEYHITYDAGSSGIRATVASFKITKGSKTGAAGTHIAVGGFRYARTTGGIELDKRMREILIDAFEDVREDKRGMAKLWEEALRVKAILSANNEAMATVENLAWDIDFKTRTEFAKPIEDVLKNAGLTLDNVTSAIVMGGSTRIPMVQTAIKAAVGGYILFKVSLLLSLTRLLSDKSTLNVNADEAAVLWAALYGASLSKQFKTKTSKVNDTSVHYIQVPYFATAFTANSRPRSITTLIFPTGSKIIAKKFLTFKKKEDFLDYKTLSLLTC